MRDRLAGLYKLFWGKRENARQDGALVIFEVYDLNALIAAEVQLVEQLALFLIHGRETSGGARLFLADRLWINEQDFPNARQQLQHPRHAHIMTLLMEDALQKGSERQRQHTIKRMDSDFAVRSVEHGRSA